MKRSICFCLLAAMVSCTTPRAKNHNNSNAKLDQLADKTCRAVGIREKRFALANKIRFAGDTLESLKGKGDTMRLHNELKVYLKQKDSLLKASLILADTIKQQLDSLVPYTDKVARKRFSAQLDSILTAKGCKITTREDNIQH